MMMMLGGSPAFRTDSGSNDYADSWLAALEEATSCLRSSSSTEEEQLQVCATKLKSLEILLKLKESQWHLAPDEPPPEQPSLLAIDSSGSSSSLSDPGGVRDSAAFPSLSLSFLGDNRFASFQDFSSDTDDEEEDEEEDDYQHKNHTPLVRRSPRQTVQTTTATSPAAATTTTTTTPTMDMRRLYIRILDAQSSLSQHRARNCRLHRQWNQGALYYEQSLQLIHKAIFHADAAISKLLASRRAAVPLQEDADIVHVAIQSLVSGREQFLSAAKKQEAFLLRKLQPQWKRRDAVKNRMGDRWYENRRPKNSFAVLRKQHEAELWDVQKAMRCATSLDLDAAEKSTLLLQQKLGESTMSTARYNGERPSAEYGRRVSWEDYPDPAEFGWVFTGSFGLTEFFEKDDIKLDWYFTTATIKTSLDHSAQGQTTLFGRQQVSPEMYTKVLLEPLSHTEKRLRAPRQKRRPKH